MPYKDKEKKKEVDRLNHAIYIQTDKGKKKARMKQWKFRGCINITDEIYDYYDKCSKCDICGKEFSSVYDKCLDHDHNTGLYRNVLCKSCNSRDNWKNKLCNTIKN